jgi:OmpA-OmpF porin, OOP family
MKNMSGSSDKSGHRRLNGLLATVLLLFASTVMFAQTTKLKGLIKGRSGATLILQTADSQDVTVLLTDDTQVTQSQGLLKTRSKGMSMAYLIPGLAIQVEGTYDVKNQLLAKSVRFNGDDLKRAQSIDAGLHETRNETKANTAELEKQNAALQEQNEALKQHQAQLNEHQENIAANKAAIEAAIARFGQLDDYYILDELTIYFANGKVNLESKYHAPLIQLAEKAKTINAYIIEIKGYASSVGSVELNQRLSQERAENVANFLIQQGHISLTNMLAPGAMGESEQIGNQNTPEAEAQNRRVVVRILQNKGIAGL